LFTVTIERSFTAGHQLTMPDGRPEEFHSHEWLVECAVAAEWLNEIGVVIDFNELDKKLDIIIGPFEDTRLEKLPFFKKHGINASAENVAKYIFDMLEPQLDADMSLEYVQVTEAKACRAKYSK